MNRAPNSAGPRPWPLGLLIFVLALGAFAGGLGGPFLLDDVPLISRNAVTQDFANAGRWLTGHLWDTTYGGASLAPEAARYWRPLVQASYAFDWIWGQGRPLAFHVTNLLLHGVASVLVFLTLRRWLRGSSGAFWGAALFALHPAKAENVSWISGRPDVLMTIGLLVALMGSSRRIQEPSRGLALEMAGAILAFASKETAIVLPFLACIEWRARANWRAWQKGDWSEAARVLGPSLLATFVYAIGRVGFLPIVDRVTPVPLLRHVVLVVETFGGYARLVFWPNDLSLFGSTIGATVAEPFVVNAAEASLGLAVVLLSAAIGFFTRRRRPALCAGVVLFLALLLPVSNLHPMPNLVLTSPRFLYLPSIAISLVFGSLVDWLAQNARSRSSRVALLACGLGILTGLGARSLVRSADFDSERAFWTYEIAHGSGGQARSFFIAEELNAKRPRAALQLLSRTLSNPSPNELRFGRSLNTLATYLRALLVVTPDVDQVSLTAIDRFVRAIRAGHFAVLDIPRRGLSITQKPIDLRTKPYQFLAIEAESASRLGDDVRAVSAARRIVDECGSCEGVLESAIVGAARAGEFELARRALRGLAAVDADAAEGHGRNLDETERLVKAAPDWQSAPVLRTQFYVTSGAWGRALESARPAFDSREPLDAATTLVLGQLALRAGDRERGEAMLHRFMNEAEVAVERRRIDSAMSWVDAERPPDQPLPVF